MRSWLMEAERVSGLAAAKETEALDRDRPVSIRERLENEGRFMEKLLTDMLEAMMSSCENRGQQALVALKTHFLLIFILTLVFYNSF